MREKGDNRQVEKGSRSVSILRRRVKRGGGGGEGGDEDVIREGMNR